MKGICDYQQLLNCTYSQKSQTSQPSNCTQVLLPTFTNKKTFLHKVQQSRPFQPLIPYEATSGSAIPVSVSGARKALKETKKHLINTARQALQFVSSR